MGLDMYLYKAKKSDDVDKAAGIWRMGDLTSLTAPEKVDLFDKLAKEALYIEASLHPETFVLRGFKQVAYWRKANAIHQWFVDNVQNGNDDCGYYIVSEQKMEELAGLCSKVLKEKTTASALENLPPQSGFFFGGTEVDDDYYEVIAETLGMLNYARWDEVNFKTHMVVYHSSW